MNSLDSWYWRIKACGQETLREHMLERLRRQDSVAASEVEKMLKMSRDAESFMLLDRHVKDTGT